MLQLKKGSYFGEQITKLSVNGLIITDTNYTHDFADWHYHENAYFTLLLRGRLTETNKKESYQLTPGSLLFHNWQDAHFNVKEPGPARGFHIEIPTIWFEQYDLKGIGPLGSFQLHHPRLKLLIETLYWETKIVDASSAMNLEMLLLQAFDFLQHNKHSQGKSHPKWAEVVRQIFNDDTRNTSYTLHSLSRYANVHPVHLSREFNKHFNCSFGQYVRTLKVQRSLHLLRRSCHSIKSIANDCGFADESHFIRQFKKVMGATPSRYRKDTCDVKNIQLN